MPEMDDAFLECSKQLQDKIAELNALMNELRYVKGYPVEIYHTLGSITIHARLIRVDKA
jgi:hypothetical protein